MSKPDNLYLRDIDEKVTGEKERKHRTNNYYLREISENIGSGGGGGGIVDDHLSTTSKNAVQNKVITSELNSIEDGFTADLELKEDKSNRVRNWSNYPSNERYPSEKLVKDSLNDKEDKENKIIAWGETPSNTEYPSAKLVSDTLEDYEVTVELQGTPEAGFSSTYVIRQGDTALTPKINIPKDFLVKSGTVEECTVQDVPIQGLNVGDSYIDFIINAKDSQSVDEHLYIDVKDLVSVVDEVTLTDANSVFAIKDGGVDTTQLHSGAVTYSKLADGLVVDNLTTNDATKLLSAKQGKVLNDLIGEALTYINM